MMNQKKTRIIIAAVLLVAAIIIEHCCKLPVWQLLLIYLIPYLVAGYDVVGEALEGLFHGKACNEDFLMFVATAGALLIGFLPGASTEFPEAVFVMLFFQVGELFEDYAEGQSKRSISHLLSIRPDTANVLRNGKVVVVAPDTVTVNETIVIKPGEKIPLDGIVTEGESSLNTVALTGESVPRKIHTGDTIVSGCVNVSGMLKVRVTKTFGESTASRIIDLVENAAENKSKSETFIAKFARVYTPIVVIVAILVAFIPPLFTGDYTAHFAEWLNRALTFLVVSCPCALVISVPLSFFGGIGGASQNGILIKGGNYMEVLSKVKTVLFDKTGTLTKGIFEVFAVHPDNISPDELLHIAAHVERFSTHPIAISLKHAYPNEQDDCSIDNVEEIPGQGVRAIVNGRIVCVGNTTMMEKIGAQWHPCHLVGTIVHISIDGQYAGHIVIRDKVKDDAAEVVLSLKAVGVRKTVMLTGDRKDVAEDVAQALGIDEYHAELMPADKVKYVEQYIADSDSKSKVAFVGDGINDAPVLARADVGIAMGGLGSDAAIEAADVVLMDDEPSKIALAVKIARKTLAIASQNAWFAILIKILVLLLAGVGLANMWMAVFADVGVTVLAVLNAMRTLSAKIE